MTSSGLDTTTTRDADRSWREYAAGLSRLLADNGDLRDPAWAAAVAAVPRHLLVPHAYQQQPDGTWTDLDTSRDLALAYSPTTLVTHVVAGAGQSSSTKPDLMLRMLEILDVADGHRVLEIGTGTGYNAALLCERLGADRVLSVDVDPDLVDTARSRLAAIGHRPHLDAHDGAEGWAAHGPYDRIIATCSVPQIPWPWAEQLVPGGLLLADLKLGASAGNLVALRRHAQHLEGRFTARWAAFMTIRTPIASPAGTPRAPRAEGSHERTTIAPAQPWVSHREVWMLAARDLPTGVTHGYLLDPNTRAPAASALTAPDGSWCEVALDGKDQRALRESGPTPLWCHVEAAYTDWQDWGEPSWERFGLTVTPDTHTVWLDEPTHSVC